MKQIDMGLDGNPKDRGDVLAKKKDLPRLLLVTGGSFCVALGVLGMFLPVLPTTPFLLLAAYCYSRSSRRFYHWLMTNRWCGEYIRNYREGNGLPLKHKMITLMLLWVTMGYAIWFIVSLWWVKFILLGIAIGVTVHLFRIKTYKPGTQQIHLLQDCNSPE